MNPHNVDLLRNIDSVASENAKKATLIFSIHLQSVANNSIIYNKAQEQRHGKDMLGSARQMVQMPVEIHWLSKQKSMRLIKKQVYYS